LLISIETLPLQVVFCVILLVLLLSFLSYSALLWFVGSPRLSRGSNQFSVKLIGCEWLLSSILGLLRWFSCM
jgi:hypothetical protein